MIISHKHKFVFIHCRKVAGSSMKVALAPVLGEDDLVVGSLNEIMNAGRPIPVSLRRILWKFRPRCTAVSARILGKSWPEAKNIAVKQYFQSSFGPNPPHPPAEKVATFLGADWENYQKIYFTRNPFERVASDYSWRRRMLQRDFTFADFVAALEDPSRARGIVHPNAVSNWDMMSIDGELIADQVGRYERLEMDFADIVSRLGLPPTPLGREKVTEPGKRRAYGALYTPALRERVERIFSPELEAFDYEFPY